MPSPDEHETVSTEPQRQALDAMSHQLVENLNAMIREQNERAQRFAATQHSVSARPAQPPIQDIEPQPTPQPTPIATAVPHLPSTKARPPRQQGHEKARQLPPRPTAQLDEGEPVPLPPPLPRIKRSSLNQQKKEQQGCSATTMIIAIVIFLILARSCG